MKSFYGLWDTFPQRERVSQRFEAKKESMRMVNYLVLSIAVLLLVANANGFLMGADIKSPEKIPFAPGIDQEPLLEAVDFCVTEDELFVIPDMDAGNIKIYEYDSCQKILKQIELIGKKGFNKNELSMPAFCYYDKDDGKFVVTDIGIRKIFIYDRLGRKDFSRVHELSCWGIPFDIQLVKNKILISGYNRSPNGEHYDFYYVDLTNNQTTFLLPSHFKYGLKSSREYEVQFIEKSELPAIGEKGFFDIYQDDAYYIWEGNLKIIKLDILSGAIDSKAFGAQPVPYTKPEISNSLLTNLKKRDFKALQKERDTMSFVQKIFVGQQNILVIYTVPKTSNQDQQASLRLQFYTLDGYFIKDVAIPEQPDSRMWFDKDKSILYSLAGTSNDYFILKYNISQ